ncbi:MAG: MalY/PatB family protein [Bacillota bacterium]|nr:MalY/PatB family protein [Bacillota bacterium]
MYNFDKEVLRRNTGSLKWDLAKNDVIPMWVADMDFETPEPIVKALKERVEHGIFGYTIADKDYYSSIINWMNKRHGWNIKKEWINFSPGVVPGVNIILRAITHPGDKVILQTPVYYPFFSAVENNGCKIVENPLIYENGTYKMDYEDLEKKLKDNRVKAFVLCNPHNPVGRVWTEEELKTLGELCIKNNVIIISDEIHGDLIYKQYRHIPFASISEELSDNCVTFIAPSKTFNIAGIQAANAIISNIKIRNLYLTQVENLGITRPNIFAIVATAAAYNEGEQWLDELINYLQNNLDYLKQYIRKNIPKIKVINPEGTYLVWLDCSELGLKGKELHRFVKDKARLWLDEGYIFGANGENFERINIACPRSVLVEALSRLERAVSGER